MGLLMVFVEDTLSSFLQRFYKSKLLSLHQRLQQLSRLRMCKIATSPFFQHVLQCTRSTFQRLRTFKTAISVIYSFIHTGKHDLYTDLYPLSSIPVVLETNISLSNTATIITLTYNPSTIPRTVQLSWRWPMPFPNLGICRAVKLHCYTPMPSEYYNT